MVGCGAEGRRARRHHASEPPAQGGLHPSGLPGLARATPLDSAHLGPSPDSSSSQRAKLRLQDLPNLQGRYRAARERSGAQRERQERAMRGCSHLARSVGRRIGRGRRRRRARRPIRTRSVRGSEGCWRRDTAVNHRASRRCTQCRCKAVSVVDGSSPRGPSAAPGRHRCR